MRILFLLITISFSSIAYGQEVAAPTPQPAKSVIRARVFYEENGRPVKRISVSFITAKRNGHEVSGLTDGNGVVEIKNVRAGTYYAVVNSPGVVSPFAFVDFRPSAGDVDFATIPFQPIIVDGISVAIVDVAARRGGAISGRLTYSDGYPAIGVKVEILRKVEDQFLPVVSNLSALAPFSSMGAGVYQTDDRGIYRVAGLPPGEYIAKVTESISHGSSSRYYRSSIDEMLFGTPSMVSVFFPEAFETENAQILKLVGGEEITEINMVVPDQNLRVLEGKILGGKETLPVRNAQLSIVRDRSLTGYNDLPATRSRQTVTTDGAGAWKFVNLPKGEYTVVVDVPNSDFDEKDRAYGPDVTEIDGVPTAVYGANSASNSQAQVKKAPQPKFARKTVKFTIGDDNLIDQRIELKFGATITGTVEIDDRGYLPTSVSIFVENDEGVSGSDMLSYYYYEGSSDPKPTKSEFRVAGLGAGTSFFYVGMTDDDYYVKSVTSNNSEILGLPLNLDEGQNLSGLKVILSKDVGTLSGSVIDDERQPIGGGRFILVPGDPNKMRIFDYHREVKTDENGEFSVKLPPIEYAMVEISLKRTAKNRDQYLTEIGELVKKAQTFKIEARKTTKATVKGIRKRSQ